MRKFTAACGALLLFSFMLITARHGATAVEEAVAAVPAAEAENLEIVPVEEDTPQVAAASTTTNTFGKWWGLPYPWWPTKFCAWDYWTSACCLDCDHFRDMHRQKRKSPGRNGPPGDDNQR
jgi:hypothetical protein